ncbi:hypothetical protein ElyMa_002114400 [Elysia marginata]|uniref:Uncharacterized protein n=1 Tax=Elysia marginata TaxID=1093978 RepID=A0AAV4FGE3_9GAST|nr:hypothetical protein ElyMa_002114400 [Elysia marginata]
MTVPVSLSEDTQRNPRRKRVAGSCERPFDPRNQQENRHCHGLHPMFQNVTNRCCLTSTRCCFFPKMKHLHLQCSDTASSWYKQQYTMLSELIHRNKVTLFNEQPIKFKPK